MRILHSIHSVNPKLGGPVEFVRSLIPIHAQSGQKMDVACMDDPKQDFVKSFPGTIKAFGPALSGYGYSPRYVPWLKENAHNYDAVIVHGLWQYSGFATWSALRKGPIPY